MKLKPNETDLLGKWVVVDGMVIGDTTTERIEALIEQRLERIAVDATGWELFTETLMMAATGN